MPTLSSQRFGDGDRLRAVARDTAGGIVRAGAGMLAVEEGEALGDAGGRPKRVRRDDAAGRVAAVAQHLGEQPFVALDREARVVAHAGFERQPARQQRRVGGQRLRHVRVRALEDDAVGGERVDRRCAERASSRTTGR